MFHVVRQNQIFDYVFAVRNAVSVMTHSTYLGFYKLSRHALSEWYNE
ncbi:hypothetical protein JCM19239_6092 [Vibrio variabilis]|uniref:Uncharacterized protein n=1 Tax=Vibrio variabilis TaxID=990271 RepID=A0ABQ0JJR8_9VIBR|nr:hypothetical protein JCM19239_6092 [Vibrio variabilis]